MSARMEPAAGHDARAHRPVDAHADEVLDAEAGPGLHLAQRHHLGVAAREGGGAEPQRQFRREVEGPPRPQDVERGDAERFAVIGVDQRGFRQRNRDRPCGVLASPLVEKPMEQRCQAIEDRLRSEREVGGLVVLDDQGAGEVGEPHRQRHSVDLRDQNGAGAGAHPEMARGAPALRRAEIALFDEAEPFQRGETVRDRGSPELGLAFDVEAGQGARPDKGQDGGEA